MTASVLSSDAEIIQTALPVCLPLWLENPYRLVNVLEMLRFYAEHWMATSSSLGQGIGQITNNGVLSDGGMTQVIEACGSLLKDCEALGLDLSVTQINRFRTETLQPGMSYASLRAALINIQQRIFDELETRQFYCLSRDNVRYFESPELFGKQVFDNLPSANQELTEAGSCLALGKGTACVFHLGRALECGLLVLAKDLGVPQQNDWGRYLTAINNELQKRMQASGARTAIEQFYAEAHITFDALRRAWRNPTMHVDKSYSPERAHEILLSVGSFIKHLATVLHE